MAESIEDRTVTLLADMEQCIRRGRARQDETLNIALILDDRLTIVRRALNAALARELAAIDVLAATGEEGLAQELRAERTEALRRCADEFDPPPSCIN